MFYEQRAREKRVFLWCEKKNAGDISTWSLWQIWNVFFWLFIVVWKKHKSSYIIIFRMCVCVLCWNWLSEKYHFFLWIYNVVNFSNKNEIAEMMVQFKIALFRMGCLLFASPSFFLSFCLYILFGVLNALKLAVINQFRNETMKWRWNFRSVYCCSLCVWGFFCMQVNVVMRMGHLKQHNVSVQKKKLTRNSF